MRDAGAQFYFDWRFRTDSDDVFAIRVSAVEWYKWNTDVPEDPYDDQWVPAGETEPSLIISIAGFW